MSATAFDLAGVTAPDEDDVHQFDARLTDLRRALADHQSRLDDFTARRLALHADEVRALVRGRSVLDPQAEEAVLSAQIVATRRSIATTESAIVEASRLLTEARLRAESAARRQAADRARDILRLMIPHAEALGALERELAPLRTKTGRSHWPPPQRPMGIAMAGWITAARAAAEIRDVRHDD